MSKLRTAIFRRFTAVSQMADFQQATTHFRNGDYAKSLVHLIRTRDILENANQQNSVDFYQTVRRLSHVYFQTENFKLAESTLQEGLALLLKHHSDDLLLNSHYSTMAKFYLMANLEKAVKLLSALLSPSQIQKVPFTFQSEFKLLLGVLLPDSLCFKEGIQSRQSDFERRDQLDCQQRNQRFCLQQPFDCQLVCLPVGSQARLQSCRF